ncbi:MAG: hypothetical protein V7642_7092 [Burkholderiales bacterium]|jgi:hypothetical protein
MHLQNDINELVTDSLGRLLAERHPVDYARTGPCWDEPGQRELWRQLVAGGWLDIADPDAENGLGHSGRLAIGELSGRALLTLPLAYHAMIAAPLVRYLAETCPDVAADIVSQGGRDGPIAGGIYLRQRIPQLLDFEGQATRFVQCRVNDRASGSIALRIVDPADVESLESLDPCVRLGAINADSGLLESTLWIDPDWLTRLLYRYFSFELADMIGAAAAALDLSVVYAKERVQFGRAIGEFHSIKHRLADAWIALENARYALSHFAQLTEGRIQDPGLQSAAGISWRLARAAATNSTKLAIQVHGGLGFSWEHSAHLYLKRVLRLAARIDELAVTLNIA